MTALESLNFDLDSLAPKTFKMAILDQINVISREMRVVKNS